MVTTHLKGCRQHTTVIFLSALFSLTPPLYTPDMGMERGKTQIFFFFPLKNPELSQNYKIDSLIIQGARSPVPFLIGPIVELMKSHHILKLSKKHGTSTFSCGALSFSHYSALSVAASRFSLTTAATWQLPFPKMWLCARHWMSPWWALFLLSSQKSWRWEQSFPHSINEETERLREVM